MTDQTGKIRSHSVFGKDGSPIWMISGQGSNDQEHEKLFGLGNEEDKEERTIDNRNFKDDPGTDNLEIHKGSLLTRKDLVRDHDVSFKKNLIGMEDLPDDPTNGFELDVLGRSRSDGIITFLREDGSLLPESEYPVNIILREKKQLDGYIIGLKKESGKNILWAIVRGEPIFNDTGEIERVALYSMDITELKNDQIDLDSKRVELEGTIGKITNELELVKSSIDHEYNYDNKIMLLSNTGSFEYDPSLKEFRGSTICNRILGVHEDVSINIDQIFSQITQNEKDSFERNLMETITDGDSKIIEINYSKGEVTIPLLVKFVSHRDPVDDRDLIIGIVQDISQDKITKSRLERMTNEIENINKTMMDRESRVIEIKEEVNELCKELGREPKYKII